MMRLFLDACAVIYQFEGANEFRAATTAVMAQLSKPHQTVELAVCRLSTLECRVKPLREANQILLSAYDEFFSQIDIIEMDSQVVDLAAQLRASIGLKTPDALQAAAAITWGDEVTFVTADESFVKVPSLHVALIKI